MRLIFGIFALVGLGLLAGAALAYRHTRQFVEIAVPAQGVVTANVRAQGSRGRSLYYPRIRFQTADSQEISFLSNTGTMPAAYDVNDRVPVLYDPLDPHHAAVRSLVGVWLLPLILGGMGALFFAIGGTGAALQAVGARKNAWLRQNGRRIQAELTRVELNRSVSTNGLHPYRIVCQWLDPVTNQMRVFKSADMVFDPTSYIHSKTIEVLIDPDRPQRYWVDTSFLPGAA